MDLIPWNLPLALAVFVGAGAVTVAGSIRLAALGDDLADRTGWGEALFGAMFFGLVTSLSGIVMTVATAGADRPELAYSNAVGGIVAQTLAVAVADGFYRRANLEHAAASMPNVLFGCLLVFLLSLALMGSLVPDVAVLEVHPVSVLMVLAYLGGLRLVRGQSARPMWEAVETAETVVDEIDPGPEAAATSARSMWAQFVLVGGTVAAGGWLIAQAAGHLVDATGLAAGFVGVVMMGLVNALPEAVTAVAAVRRGATTLAVAAVLGGNCLDALNLVAGDVAYRGGSLYHAVGADQLFTTAASLAMTIVLVAGLLVREPRGPGRIGFEGITLVLAYVAIVLVQVV
jgi:cation:H+ antiporter